MSEKRFTHQRTDDYNFSDILDNGKWIGICHVDCEDDFVDKFNELNDENKLLLRKNGAMEEEIECLSEENEQLKCEVYSYKCSTETNKEIIEDLHKEYKVLEKENKELKKQVDEMINIFNDSGLDYHISDELEEILND